MKLKLLLLGLILFSVIPAFAQKSDQGKDKDKEKSRQEMLDFKLDFISSEMDLKDSQKKQFVELYSKMETERRAILKRIKTAEKSVSDNKNASEADYEKASREISTARSEMVQIEKNYDEKFSKFLTQKQMFKMKEAENKFLQKMQECKQKKKHERKDKK